MEQSKKLLVAILVSSLITNIILLGLMGVSLAAALKVKAQVDEIHQRLETVHNMVETIKSARDTIKETVGERRQGSDKGGEDKPTPRRPLKRLRGSE